MYKYFLSIVFALLAVVQLSAQTVNVSNITATGRFASCGNGTPTVTMQYIAGQSSGTTLTANGITCNNPCGKTTVRIQMSNISWGKNPGDEWLHGIFLPANAGYTVNGINLPTGFITYNNGCQGQCPNGTTAGPGFYYDNTGNQSCCTGITANNGIPCDNWGDPFYSCNGSFGLFFDLTFCNSTLTTTTETFTFTGTSDGATGCWINNSNAVNQISFTINIVPCAVVALASTPTADTSKAICVGGVSDYTSTLSGVCTGNGSGPFWWTSASGGGLIGSGSPFEYNPAGVTCPAGQTLYMSCCPDSNVGCSARFPVTIPVSACNPFLIQSIHKTLATCNNPNSIDSIKTTGKPGLVQYTLMPGNLTNTTGTFNNLSNGVYTVTATNGLGCTLTTSITMIGVFNMIFNISKTSPNCFGDATGVITANTSFGVNPKVYSITPNLGTQTGNVFSNLPAGVYTVNVVDNNSCTASTIVTITEPPVLSAAIISSGLCAGSSVISANANPSGGIGPYSYIWDNNPTLNSLTYNNVLIGNTYSLQVTDSKNCTASATSTIVLPPQLLLSYNNLITPTCVSSTGSASLTTSGGVAPFTYNFGPTGSTNATLVATGALGPNTYTAVVTDAGGCTASTILIIPAVVLPNLTTVQTNVACFGGNSGSAKASASSGSMPYNYSWNTTPVQNTATADSLIAGTYIITVTDNNNCTSTTTVVITQPASITASINLTTPIACNGNTNASATASGIGGTLPYTYSWNTTPIQTNATATNLSSGSYQVTITDAVGCSSTTSILITEPNILQANINLQTPIICNGNKNASAIATANGGTNPYTFAWNTTPIQTTATATNLSAGSYQVQITDANNCTTTATILITQPTALIANIASSAAVNCFGGATGNATVAASGGTTNYTYAWNTIPTQTTANATNLSAGTYQVIVTDANNCSSTTSITIIQPTQALSITNIATIQPGCNPSNNGSITVTAIGGTTTYSYQLNSNAPQISNQFNGLTTGIYTITVIDNKGCTAQSTAQLSNPSIPTASINLTTPIACNGNTNASATASGTGGTLPYVYSWNTTPIQTNAVATNLSAGSYQVTITDAVGCIATTSILITQPNILQANINLQTPIICNGNTNASAIATANGGTNPYTFAWNTTPIQTTATATNLSAGSYQVQITDANNCTTTATILITQPTALIANIASSAAVNCFGGATGNATVAASGGTTNYTYAWNTIPTQTTANATNLSAGTYQVIVTDANNCSSTTSITIIQPTQALSITNIATIQPGCNPSNNGSITVTAIGGTTTYSYQLNSNAPQISNQFNGLTTGIYTITVIDNKGCTAQSTTQLSNPSIPTASINLTTPIACNGNTNASATASGTGGTLPYVYSWNTTPIQTNAVATNLSAGSYQVTITDAVGCIATTSILITQPNILQANINLQTPIICNGNTNASAIATANGGTNPYTFAWNTTPIQTTATATNLSAGSYQVQITDANNCTSTATILITQPTALIANITSSTAVNCFGGTTGNTTVAASGGTTNYTYVWNAIPTQTTATATNLSAGTYQVIVTDANNCSSTASITITQPTQALSITNVATIQPGCNPSNNGSITVTAIGGTTTYSYQLNSNAPHISNQFNGLTTGIYTITVIDNKGCTAQSTTQLSNPSIPTASINLTTPIACNGNTNASATASGTGGTLPYVYSWNTTPIQTNAIATNLSAGTYQVTITDAVGCSATTSILITEPNILQANINLQTPIICNGNTNAAALATANGGTNPYTFAWNTTSIQTTATATNLSAGSYQVQITDANNCTTIATILITQPTALVATITSSTAVNCFGGTTGNATVAASGGTTNYTYAWNAIPTQTTATATNLSAGTYQVIVTDANNCSSTASVAITEPTQALSLTNLAILQPGCNPSNNGSITVTAIGGTTTYSYQLNSNTPQISSQFNSLTTGIYTITVIDNKGCTAQSTAQLSNPSIPTANINLTTPIACNGTTNASATASGIGGTLPYVYSWNTTPIQTNAIATNLSAGSYQVTITDAVGCSATTSILITQPNLLQANINLQTPIICNGNTNASIIATANGGTNPYTFAWNTTPIQTTATATNLSAGSYQVQITDANNCTTTATILITQPTALVASISNSTAVNCFGGTTGNATVAASGGTTNYTYAWNTIPTQTTATATNLSAGTYQVIVTDANNCSSTASVTITEPTQALSITNVATIQPGCNPSNNGSITVTAIGGTTTYSYQLNSNAPQISNQFNGLTTGIYTITVIDNKGCTAQSTAQLSNPSIPTASINLTTPIACNGNTNASATASGTGGTLPYVYSWNTTPLQTNAIAINLSAGSYQVTITDAVGCSATTSILITQPNLLQANINLQTPIICNGNTNASIIATANGGTNPYTFAWNTTPIQTTATATNLSAGSYQVQITDANNCTSTATILITQPTALVASITSSTAVNCFGGTTGNAIVAASGGTTNYTYAWNTIPTQTTATATNLSAGTYQVTITDANNCTSTASVTITQPTQALSITNLAILQPGCNPSNNGSITVTAIGGTTTYSYQLNSNTPQISNQFNSLTTGIYTITVIDNKGCTAQSTTQLSNPSIPTASINLTTPIACNGNTNASATASGTGGTLPYVYSWNTTPIQTNATATNLSAGSYQVTITDAVGCSATTSILITEPNILQANINLQTPIICNGNTNASIIATANGGTNPYTFAWNTTPIQTTATATNLSAGSYQVQITDANNCTTTATILITQPTALVASISNSTAVNCFGGTTGNATVAASGGTTNYTYAWNTIPTQTTATATNLSAGTYQVIVTDANNCSSTASITITQPTQALSISNVATLQPGCNPSNNGSITVTAIGGTTTYSYQLNSNTPQISNQFNGLTTGIYTITVIDNKGCTAQSTAQLSNPSIPTASINLTTPIACNGNTNASVTASGTGGTLPYTYAWNTTPMQTNATATNLSAGSYQVTITDAVGCSATTSILITEPNALQGNIITTVNPTFNGATNGGVNSSAIGGTGAYNFQLFTGASLIGANTNGIFSNLSATNYFIAINDSVGCVDTIYFSLAQPLPLIIDSISSTNLLCNGNQNGTAAFFISGGTKPYQATLLNSGNTTLSGDTAYLSSLAAGNYTLVVTDFSGVSSSAVLNISEPSSLIIDSITIGNPKCFPTNSGSLFIYANGGVPSYMYSLTSTAGPQSNALFQNLLSGTYQVIVSDANGCSVSNTAILNLPNLPSIQNIVTTNESCVPAGNGSIVIDAISSNGSLLYGIQLSGMQLNDTIFNLSAGNYIAYVKDSLNCIDSISVMVGHVDLITSLVTDTSYSTCVPGNDGTVQLSTIGGSAPFQYSINSTPNSGFLGGLSVGNYTASVVDQFGCTASTAFSITLPAAPNISNITITNAKCFGANDGAVVVEALGFNAIATYSIPLLSITNTNGQFSFLNPATYSVVAADIVGCTTFTTVTITSPTALNYVISNVINVSCNGGNNGAFTIAATGGTAPYSYAIIGLSSNNTGVFSQLFAGTYTIQITDANNCFVTTTISISEPTILVATVDSITGTICANTATGIVDIGAIGGTTPYLFTLGSVTNATGYFNQLNAGNYIITILDANNCSISTNIIITQPPAISLDSLSLVQPLCNGDANGKIYATASGGTGGLQYAINVGIFSINGLFQNLQAGNYMISVKDVLGCQLDSNVIMLEPNTVIFDSILISHVTCFQNTDGNIIASGSGGTPGLLYTLLPFNISNTSGIFSSVNAGNFTIVVTDSKNCSASAAAIVTEPSPLIVTQLTTTNPKCYNSFDGAISIQMQGGTQPYIFKLLPGTTQNSTGQFLNLNAGNYTIQVVDANGCSTNSSTALLAPPAITIDSIYKKDIRCFGDSSGLIVVAASGGSGILQYQISGNVQINSNGNFNNLFAGTYTITISDINNCSVSTLVMLNQNSKIIIDSIQLNSPKCFGLADGSIYIKCAGGVGNLSCSLAGTNFLNNNFISNLAANVYPLAVVDSLGCRLDSNIILTQPNILVANTLVLQNNICEGNKNGICVTGAVGGTKPYTSILSPNFVVTQSDTIRNLGSGSYTLSVKDANQCLFTTTFQIGVLSNPLSVNTIIDNVTCFGFGNNGKIEILVNGGFEPYLYKLNGLLSESVENIFDSLSFGNYIVEVSDSMGCKIEDSAYLAPAPCCEVFLPNSFSPNNDDINELYIPIGGAGYQIKQFAIYDRWGNQVFSTNKNNEGWDGTYKGVPVDMDTYFVYFSYKCLFDNKIYIRKNDINMIK